MTTVFQPSVALTDFDVILGSMCAHEVETPQDATTDERAQRKREKRHRQKAARAAAIAGSRIATAKAACIGANAELNAAQQAACDLANSVARANVNAHFTTMSKSSFFDDPSTLAELQQCTDTVCEFMQQMAVCVYSHAERRSASVAFAQIDHQFGQCKLKHMESFRTTESLVASCLRMQHAHLAVLRMHTTQLEETVKATTNAQRRLTTTGLP
jgi:hypothetical protein